MYIIALTDSMIHDINIYPKFPSCGFSCTNASMTPIRFASCSARKKHIKYFLMCIFVISHGSNNGLIWLSFSRIKMHYSCETLKTHVTVKIPKSRKNRFNICFVLVDGSGTFLCL